MFRAFVEMSACLNLSLAAKTLGVTRQTVRRHIDALEEIKACKLFEYSEKGFFLTDKGKEHLPGAIEIIRLVNQWETGQSGVVTRQVALEASSGVGPDGAVFYSQRHSLTSLWRNGPTQFQDLVVAWGKSQGQIEHQAISGLRKYLVLYRKVRDGWVCMEVGEDSAYAKWFGWVWAKSAVGALSEEDEVGDGLNQHVARAYKQIFEDGGIRYDHLHATLPRHGHDGLTPVSFQRLLCGCMLPDGHPALIVYVLITDDIKIDALRDMDIPTVPAEFTA